MEKGVAYMNYFFIAQSYITKYKTVLGKNANKKGKKKIFLNFEITIPDFYLLNFE